LLGYKSLKKILKILYKNFIYLDKNSINLISHNLSLWKNFIKKDSKNLLLIDYIESREIEIARSYFCNLFAKQNDCKITVFSNQKNILINREWKKIYSSFNANNFIYIFYSKFFFKLFFNLKKKKEIKNSLNFILKNIKSKKDLTSIKYKDLEIGREIYHEYIYRFRKPTVELSDKAVVKLIYEAIIVTEYWIDFFKENKVKAITLSHPNVRFLALSGKIANQFYSIPVYAVTCSYIKKYLNLADHYQFIRDSYLEHPKKFNQLSETEKKESLEWGKNRLNQRLNGVVGVDMYYTSVSAFHKQFIEQALKKSDNIKVLICTHEFYDDPNATGGLLFPDFYEWLVFLGEKSKDTKYDWYIKNHPDTDPWTKKEIKKFVEKYNHIRLINEKTSFLQLKKEGLNFVFTAHGTVGHECPLLDIQVINADLNQVHIAYDFTWTPKSVDELESMINKLESMNKKIDRESIYEYFYVTNKLYDIDNFVFNSYRSSKREEREKNIDMSEIFLNEFNLNKHEQIKQNFKDYI
jgi:hypothetical protein